MPNVVPDIGGYPDSTEHQPYGRVICDVVLSGRRVAVFQTNVLPERAQQNIVRPDDRAVINNETLNEAALFPDRIHQQRLKYTQGI